MTHTPTLHGPALNGPALNGPALNGPALNGPALNGRDIGQAEHATRAVLNLLLARTGTPFHGWVILNLLGTNGGMLGEDEMAAQVIRGLQVGDDAAHAAAADLASHGLIRREPSPAGTQVALTDAGAARFDLIQAGISEVSARLYGGMPEADLATAHRVLATVTERAHAELAR